MKITKKITLLAILAVILGAAIWGYFDYQSWLALGPGGVPYNLNGWAQVTWMRLWKKNPLDTAHFEQSIGKEGDSQGLSELPRREGNRPHIDPHPVPHRQKDQFGDEQTRQALQQIFDNEIANNAQLLTYQKSHFERRNDAIFLREPKKGNLTTKAQGEIAHIHPSDGSMHMTLSPSDAKKVIEAGWGELHSLAGEDGVLPATYMMIYSPRNKEENAVAEQILKAAVKYAAGNLLE